MMPANPAPRISVIMAVYNGAPFLSQAIDSVLAQDFMDFEFLIHDDGSTDGTRAILNDYAARDTRIVLSSGPNEGLAASINQLIAKARSDLLARMDADDICLPDRFTRQVAWLDAHPDHVALGCSHIEMDAVGRHIYRNAMPQDHARIDSQNLRGITSLHHPTVMMRKSAVVACGGYDPQFETAEDLHLWLRLAEVGCLANLPDTLLYYRLHGGSVSGARGDLQRSMCRQACENAWARRGLTGISFDYQDWRMNDTAASRRAFHLRYGWQAWNSGYRGTWRHYALQSVRDAPFSVDAWKLLVLGALRRPRESPHA